MTWYVTGLTCPTCGRTADARRPAGLCACGSPLLVDYDADALAREADRDAISSRPPTMWRYREFLPLEDPQRAVSLGEGFTPLVPAGEWGRERGLAHLLVKDEGLNPTGTFKARGASCGVSRAAELGIRTVALASAGNAGGAWAAYGARAGLEVHVAMPRDAPETNRLECALYGAEVTLVGGLISDAGAAIVEGAERMDWFDASTLREPYRIEGKKTLGLEVAEQLGWQMPDAIVYPAGGGVGIIGIWRGLRQLRGVGWVEGSLPRLFVVQAEGCAPLVDAFEQGREESTFWEGAETIATGLRVPKALGDFLVLRAMRETGGGAVAVSDRAILETMASLARGTGVVAGPEGAAAVAGAFALRARGDLSDRDRVVAISTGSGLKDPEALRRAAVGY